ncbi:hypothetical protein ID866_6203 [Astraeus odoratus]|nr:hypothetical protein ID866_6203 [Astraeus odoratus]
MDTSVVLQDFFRRATKFSPNLNGQVCIDYTESPKYGGVAFVRRGVLHWEKEKTMVAVKTFRQVVDDINKLEHILWEVHIHSKLNHKNILRMLGISTDFDNTISIISPWMGMGDAHTYVQLEQNDPRPLLRDTASGLHYLHTHDLGPIVHGDLKGMNVLVSDDHRALLAGFSFSTLTKPSLGMNGNPRQGGTLRWMAPELVDDFNPSVAGDIWAYGMTVLELFTRLRPFHAKSSSASVVVSIIEARLPDRPTKASTCSRMTDAWWDICTLCWQKDPSSRPTASELLEKIRKIMGSA